MQGMAAPLIAEKRDGRHGIITHADADQKPKVRAGYVGPASDHAGCQRTVMHFLPTGQMLVVGCWLQGTVIQGKPSKVVLLRNMVSNCLPPACIFKCVHVLYHCRLQGCAQTSMVANVDGN